MYTYIYSNANAQLSSHQLTNVQQLILFGVVISSDLSKSSHSRLVRAKMSSRLGTIRRFGRCLNAKARHLVYNTFIWPHLYYYLCMGNTNAVTTTALCSTACSPIAFELSVDHTVLV